ncbi:class I SAM-dependent methyltransferase [Asticcacaulis sp. BYS171W]|uniref:Class I SAM-dependent methyltransferase n=1 Tax=Asticcacaulis aquaticus TaxID=2984212 RepID=A0ABT5HUG5_9CAUL|nr:class I SAM-dependent methyltransferase [Asticcacaulis aquaticus]MDC7683715.1 class I SAM-dependent methyltransferase [Asticcacaulis aquaticus]
MNALQQWISKTFQPKRAAIHQLPDRKLMRDAYLPAFAEVGGSILFIGCRGYTRDYYSVLEAKGAKVWTTDIDPRAERFGRQGHHRTGDICDAALFADIAFDGVICNGVLGYGVDSVPQQVKALDALSHILKPGAPLLLGWNTDKIDDPVAAVLTDAAFTPQPFAGQPARVRFDDVTHVYDSFVRKG